MLNRDNLKTINQLLEEYDSLCVSLQGDDSDLVPSCVPDSIHDEVLRSVKGSMVNRKMMISEKLRNQFSVKV